MDRLEIVDKIDTIFYLKEKKRLGKEYRNENSLAKKILHYGLGVVFAPLGLALVVLYRHLTDICRNKCGNDSSCYNKCYYMACDKVVKEIDKEMRKEKNEKKIKKLQKEKTKWIRKREKYKKRI